MTDATILLEPGGRTLGSAFLCLPGVVVTAAHVLGSRPAGQIRVRLGSDSVAVPVERLECAEELDVAALWLAAPEVRALRAGAAGVDTRWIVTSRPADNDPQLTGRVVATNRDIVNGGGAVVSMLQLDVDQALGDYGGYSGSAVRLRERPDVVIGVLCEQVRARQRRPEGRSATTVLYAVPIDAALRRLGLQLARDVPHRFAGVRERLGERDMDGADRALARVPADARDAEYWFWRAQTARARGNWHVAAAYLDEALKRDARHAPSISVKICQLLLTNDPTDRTAAARLVEKSRGWDPDLDAWTGCVEQCGLLTPGIRSETELIRLCPLPEFDLH
ncbi:hypothetical protein O7623_23815 [Solwaraspora sp. WMMD791]|uniref:hypothetical protein n=1 Tax=Solwaraspora sp. WMMD791 TaxID=3016086 RepID=UPI00249BD700|nr:hypothetical protein [Solwaraspora sp. WMMD791]WFE26337.1 hypothetical protein O7623_23815 [Solwaraspora sp. WMMD791]